MPGRLQWRGNLTAGCAAGASVAGKQRLRFRAAVKVCQRGLDALFRQRFHRIALQQILKLSDAERNRTCTDLKAILEKTRKAD